MQEFIIRGHNENAPNVWAPVWSNGATILDFYGNGTALKVASEAAADDSGSTGAEKVRVYGINPATGLEAYEDVVMDGQTEVALTGPLTNAIVINAMEVIDTGTGLRNADNIWIGYGAWALGVPATAIGVIDQYHGRSFHGHMLLPNSGKSFLQSWEVKTTTATTADFHVIANHSTSGHWMIDEDHEPSSGDQRGGANFNPTGRPYGGIELPQGCSISLHSKFGAGASEVTGHMTIWHYPEV